MCQTNNSFMLIFILTKSKTYEKKKVKKEDDILPTI